MSDQKEEQIEPFAKKEAKEPAKTTTKKTARKKVAKKVTQPDITGREVVILNEDGTDEATTFTVSKVTSKTVFLDRNIPDLREVMISGNLEQVDYKQLKKMSPEAIMFGKPVSHIIIAIELEG